MLHPKKKKLSAIRPHLATLIDLLAQLESAGQDECTEFAGEFNKPVSEMCNDLETWYGNGTLSCWQCVFSHFGLELINFGDVDRELQQARFRALLEAYLFADARLRSILAGMNCVSDFDIASIPSVIDLILGTGKLTLTYIPDNPEIEELAKVWEATRVWLPEDEFRGAEERLADQSPYDYQTIGFLFTHEIGHLFHNRLQEVVYVGQQGGTVTLTFDNQQTRTVILPADTPGVVRDYFQAVGGYYNDTGQRDFNFPSEYANAAPALTSLNYYGPNQPLDIYNADGTIREDIKAGFDPDITIHRDSRGREYVYVRLDGRATNNQVHFFEPNSYVPDLRSVQAYLDDHDEGTPGIDEFFPNERRSSSELKEGFADSFAAYLLRSDILAGTTRGDFFDEHMGTWLCQLLQEALA